LGSYFPQHRAKRASALGGYLCAGKRIGGKLEEFPRASPWEKDFPFSLLGWRLGSGNPYLRTTGMRYKTLKIKLHLRFCTLVEAPTHFGNTRASKQATSTLWGKFA
jgi:hypothetical protein